MRYERLTDLLRLAILLQGRRNGMTTGDICDEFAVSRRTAERMRDAVEAAFGALEEVERGDGLRHWRLESRALAPLVRFSPREVTEVLWSANAMRHAGMVYRAHILEELADKLAALTRARTGGSDGDAEIEALTQAEGLAMRPGPREELDEELLYLLRDAIATHKRISFDYLSRSTGKFSRQLVAPLGLLYGNRAFLVARSGWTQGPRLWRLNNIDDAYYAGERFDPDPEFDLRAWAARSFGTFQEKPVDVVLRFPPGPAVDDAIGFLFHPSQSIEREKDGTLRVRFRAGGIEEMCWHLATWGDAVVVEQPPRLRRRLAAMGKALAAHHRG